VFLSALFLAMYLRFFSLLQSKHDLVTTPIFDREVVVFSGVRGC
jgi:uncharacterized membrane protein (DUF485 family)